MTVHARRVAGVIFFKIDGEQVAAKGSFEYRLSGVQNEAIPNADGSVGIGGKFNEGYIKGTIANYGDTDHAAIKAAEGVTITLELANGKVIVARDAFQTDEAVGNVEAGEIPIQFSAEIVEEV